MTTTVPFLATATDTDAHAIAAERDALIDDLLGAAGGVFKIFCGYLGVRLGLYDALASGGPSTSVELSSRTGTNERYVREWLEQQTVTGILRVENPEAGPTERRFELPTGHAEVLTAKESLNYLGALPLILAGAVHPIQQLVDAFRTGAGIAYHDFGPDLHEGQAGMNRNAFLYQLGDEWLPSIPDLHTRLSSDVPARIADVGCGHGWSAIGMAKAYPNTRVDGFDLDAASVEAAQRHVREAGLEDRVSIQLRDAGDAALSGHYDLVTAFECIHDMPDPVSVLATMRRLANGNGTVIVMDERVGETFTPEGNEVEWFMYGFSVTHCLPVGMVEQPSAGTGTVMRPSTLRRYAIEAGFRDMEILPIENYFFTFYRLIS